MFYSGQFPYRTFSIVLASLIATASVVGLTNSSFYQHETASWQAQCVGQDWINLLLLMPVLLLTAFAIRRKPILRFAWAGIVAYLVYTFVIYSFAVRFNSLFPVYCLILGISFYGLAGFALAEYQILRQEVPHYHVVKRIIGFFFILIAIVFYLLWLGEILPASFRGVTPASLTRNGLLTNPVQVLDLAIFLPAVLFIGFGLIKNKRGASALAVALLSFFILMNLTIAWLAAYMYFRQIEEGIMVVWVMLFLTLISIILLILLMRSFRSGSR